MRIGKKKKNGMKIAKMDGYVKDLIDKGIYRFTIDKNGKILPTIRDAIREILCYCLMKTLNRKE